MKIYNRIAITVGVLTAVALMAAADADEPMTRLEDGTYVVDTSTLCANVRGYRSSTPVKVYIKKNKVLKVEFLPNRETPRYFNLLTGPFQQSWDGQKVDAARTLEPDGYTGATFSALAVKENVRAALEYYQEHKK